MAYTQADIDALKAAIAQGVKSVRSGDDSVEYQSVADMRAVLAQMEREVNATTVAPRRTVGIYRSGF